MMGWPGAPRGPACHGAMTGASESIPEAEDEAAPPWTHAVSLSLRIWSLRQPRAEGREFIDSNFSFLLVVVVVLFYSLEHKIIFTHFF